MTLVIPRYAEGAKVPFERIARALLSADQFDDWLPDAAYYQDQFNEMDRTVNRVKALWNADSLAKPEAEVLALPRTTGARVPALALPLDVRICAHVVITAMAPRIAKALPRDKVYGFRFLRDGNRLFDPPGEELERVFDMIARAAQAAASGAFEVLDIVAFNASAQLDRLVETLQQCGARPDECNFLRGVAALVGGGLPSIDDAFAFVYNFYLQPVDVFLMEQRHNFFRYRDEYFLMLTDFRAVQATRRRSSSSITG